MYFTLSEIQFRIAIVPRRILMQTKKKKEWHRVPKSKLCSTAVFNSQCIAMSEYMVFTRPTYRNVLVSQAGL
jgi:hypothetical protein